MASQQKIMVVDDDPAMQMLILRKFRQQIKNDTYYFYFVENGAKALEILDKKNGINLLLVNINMPEMDGLTLSE